ncbi:3-hydroxyacyl-CoA dehydrogenase [Tianweitania sp. BSSL-BM11]|uniref:3-hydroxyacyl-CoA dehydrogenase n=1 Tax=Tianweitania aestuarii TaxID=2814886 RepID=A0ABS5RVS3_9HYPH|nr:3-hydroxyacyl-CoA dehydrogenase [Tianweitania aestuarii]MBS9721121.1 3-hydroxyacyl-CoA dehydrogenase [Tianweitania aestuarii]
MNLSGQVAIVTGGGSGLGEATARAMAAQGAKVALFDIGMERAEKVASEIGGLAVKCDVSSDESATAAVAEVVEKLGTPRVLVNCAGIVLAAKTLGKEGPHPLDTYRKVIEINLLGTFNVIRLVADKMRHAEPQEDGERGVIINTASVAAYDGQVGQAAYSASKGGIVGMTLPIARDLARDGIRVMTIAPGIFWTPMMASLPENAQKSLGEQVPFPSRLGQPTEYADLAMHIIGNRMLNGEVIRLDGAIRMAPR